MIAHAQIDVAQIDTRLAAQKRVSIRALVREAGSSHIDIDVVDLSASGFRFESFYAFAKDARVFLSIPSLQPLDAHVAWQRGSQFGCRFVKPMHAAVFETIAARFG